MNLLQLRHASHPRDESPAPHADEDFYSYLTRSRDWKTWKATRTMDFDEMWRRAYGIFMCGLLMVLVIVMMIEDPLGNWFW